MRQITLALALSAAAAQPAPPATSWHLLGPSPPSTLLTFRLALAPPPAGLAALREAHAAVSSPSSLQWGQHLTREAADALAQPAAATQAAVLAHLASSCAASAALTPCSAWAVVHASAACAQELFGVQLQEYSSGGGRVVHRCSGQPRIPQGLEAAVAAVAPCSRLPLLRSLLPASASPSTPTTPSTIRQHYQLGSYQAAGAGRLQVAGFLGEFAEDSDLQRFFKAYYPAGLGRHFAVVGPNGATSGVEAALDVQYAMSIGSNISTTFFYTDAGPAPNPNDNEPYLAWLLSVCALPDSQLPHTISVSYSDNEDTIAPAYAAAVEALQARLGVRGVSLLHASGDGGVAGTQGGACLPPGGSTFRPTWPSSSPYVTSVGSTDASYAAASGFSAGGFSNLHSQPAWQAAAVGGYWGAAGSSLPPASHYNASGRGIPDVAAVGEGFRIISGGSDMGVDGTSCSTPVFAGMVALANDARVAAGKRGLGFLNALLYSSRAEGVFTDIAAGSNPGCGTAGFPAAKGWDPVTGLGTPVWPELLKLAMETLP